MMGKRFLGADHELPFMIDEDGGRAALPRTALPRTALPRTALPRTAPPLTPGTCYVKILNS